MTELARLGYYNGTIFHRIVKVRGPCPMTEWTGMDGWMWHLNTYCIILRTSLFRVVTPQGQEGVESQYTGKRWEEEEEEEEEGFLSTLAIR